MTVQTTVLKDVAMVMLDFSVWSGSKKLEPSDFINVDVQDLPPSRVASYGIKHLIEKERLQPFKTIRNQAERVCNRYGTRLLGGYAIPLDCVEVIGVELQAICAKFNDEVDNFIQAYDDAIADWIVKNPEFAEPLRRAMLPRSKVKSRFSASFSIFEVSASPRDKTNSLASVGGELLDSVLLSIVNGVKPQLASKTGNSASDWFRVEVRQSIVEAAQKLRRFSFCDRSGGMKVLADDLEASVAGSGKIHGAEFEKLWAIISRFTSLDAMKQFVEECANRAPANLAIAGSAPSPDTIKDDLGFPMSGFVAGEAPASPDAPVIAEDKEEALALEAEAVAASDEEAPANVVSFPMPDHDQPVKFADTFDF